ncbi:peptidase [Sedimentitalea sp. CY04]|uniref:ATP-dependent Clp protease proteolytic subunit n=1 Tax=Parasedimentitalea denitrificans TaxID=2211118 RepID=A0ABX0WC64_9RHOB|nr:head maturation protease, ClpP-related [Sedimentitalea sp. CY04]NIZ63294.1 peptidase [Sedimentitalea sp. CY04]
MTNRTMPMALANRMPGVKSDLTPKALQSWNPDLQPAAEALGDNSITMLGTIEPSYGDDTVTAKRVSAALRKIGADNPVDIFINSPGGDVFEGLAIYSMLLEHKGKVTVKVLGLAASAASIVAMAADELQIMRSAFLMIHNTWVCACGDKHAFREVANWLDPFDSALADIYHARTGIEKPDVTTMLDKETWIGGADAVERGFADSLLGAEQVSQGVGNASNLSPDAAKIKADLLMARGNAPRSMRRELLAALQSGTPSAAEPGTPSAAQKPPVAKALLDIFQNT